MMNSDLNELKKYIKNNVQIFLLIDYLKKNQSRPEVETLLTDAGVYLDKPWYAEINILYSTVTLIIEYIKKNNRNDFSQLDPTFNLNEWCIFEVYEHDDNNARSMEVPSLEWILKRMRNSISHGKFELIINESEISRSQIIFYDSNPSKKVNKKRKNFKLTFNVMCPGNEGNGNSVFSLAKFLFNLEKAFCEKFP